MKLEDQIKQKEFKSQLQKALINIAFTHSYMLGHMNKLFKPHSISMQQFNVMRILKGQHPEAVSVNDITDRMIDKMSNASRLVEKLRLKGLVERNTCSFDRRQVDVSLTSKGLQKLEELNNLTAQNMEHYAHVSEDELELLNNTLDKLREREDTDF